MERRNLVLVAMVVAVAIAAWLFLARSEDRGNPRFFADQTYNYQTIRALNDVAAVGGDTSETLQAIAGLKSGDAQGWYAAWSAAGDRVSDLANRTADRIEKGNALLRAHTYYRTAEFFLLPDDPRRAEIWKKNTDAFFGGLDVLEVKYERITAPYGKYKLNAIYFPGPAGSQRRPLLVMVGGYDSTMEELYFSLAAAARERGYSVLLYEGPGQGSIIREQHLVFTPDWEKPNGAVLDAFLSGHPKPAKVVLIGESLGGYLAPRAAAFDSRVDGVVAYDVFFDGAAIATRAVPRFALWLKNHGYRGVFNFLAGLPSNPGAKWAKENGMWVFGMKEPAAVLDNFDAYVLAPVASRIMADVLILAGTDDHFVPLQQVAEFKRSLTNARSVTSIVYDRASGGSEHCQLGAPSIWHADLFDWLAEKFG